MTDGDCPDVIGRRRAVGALAAGVGLGWAAPTILTTTAAGAQSGCALCGANLLACGGGAGLVAPTCFIGDADWDPNVPQGTDPPLLVDPPWTVTNGLRVCDYGHVDMPTSSDLTPPSPDVGTNLFCGSFSGGASPATATQGVDIADCAAQVDAGSLGYALSAYLGGNPAVASTATLTATFRDLAAATLGTATLGPLDSTDLAATGLVLQQTSGTLPVGTRSVRVELSFGYSGSAPVRNTACADLLSFTIC